MKVKEPTDIKSSNDGPPGSTINTVFGLYNHDYDGFADYEDVRAHFKNIDLIVPLGCAECYKMQEPWFNFRSITEEGSPYLKLNNSVFSAPEGAFTITNAENDRAPELKSMKVSTKRLTLMGCASKKVLLSVSQLPPRTLKSMSISSPIMAAPSNLMVQRWVK